MINFWVVLFALAVCAIAKPESEILDDTEEKDGTLKFKPHVELTDGIPILPPGSVDIEGNEVDSIRIVRTITVQNGGPWGTWRGISFCPPDTFAAGYDMKIEPNQKYGDDTALNGIKILCKTKTGHYRGDATSAVGPWGRWIGSTFCKENNESHTDFMTAFSLQVEPKQGVFKDDTAANFARFKCRGLTESNRNEYEIVAHPGHGLWGNWGLWSSSCPQGTAICGIQTKVEAKQYAGDDTALNDAKFFCCTH